MLGAYADSDDEENDISEKPAQSKEANGNQSTDIDSTLANFLAVRSVFVFGFLVIEATLGFEFQVVSPLCQSVSPALFFSLSPSPSLSISPFVPVVRTKMRKSRVLT